MFQAITVMHLCTPSHLQNKEFELSCSQEDQSCDMDSGRGRKRRKASIASNSIMV
jgi:hypothetical protein